LSAVPTPNCWPSKATMHACGLCNKVLLEVLLLLMGHLP
jgi:hypothetical protein